MPYCFDVRFRTPRPVGTDRLEEMFSAAPFTQPLRFYRPVGMNTLEGWLAVDSCGYADYGDALAAGAQLSQGLLLVAAKRKVGLELYLRGGTNAIHVYPGGQFELRDPGLPFPTLLTDQELKEMVSTAAESTARLTANQRIAAELLNDSLFRMTPEASFLLRISAVEALCPQAEQTGAFKTVVDGVLASIPEKASDRDQIVQALKNLRARRSVRSSCKSKVKQLIGDKKADTFDDLYEQRSKFVHDGSGRGTLGPAADAALEIGLALLLADIAQSS
jgi:hypothetical protein